MQNKHSLAPLIFFFFVFSHFFYSCCSNSFIYSVPSLWKHTSSFYIFTPNIKIRARIIVFSIVYIDMCTVSVCCRVNIHALCYSRCSLSTGSAKSVVTLIHGTVFQPWLYQYISSHILPFPLETCTQSMRIIDSSCSKNAVSVPVSDIKCI